MHKDDLPQLVTLIAALASAYRQEPDEATYLSYRIGLDGCDIESIRKAVEASIRYPSPFMPSPGELREMAEAGGMRMTLEMRALAAWDVVLTVIRQAGAYMSVQFDDPAAQAAIRTIAGAEGWPGLCGRKSEEMKWVKKEFVEAYKAHVHRGVTDEQAAPLHGLIDQSNIPGGYGASKVSLIACNVPGQQATKRIGGGQQNKLPAPVLDLAKNIKPADEESI